MEKVAQKNMNTQAWVKVVILAIILFSGLTFGIMTAIRF